MSLENLISTIEEYLNNMMKELELLTDKIKELPEYELMYLLDYCDLIEYEKVNEDYRILEYICDKIFDSNKILNNLSNLSLYLKSIIWNKNKAEDLYNATQNIEQLENFIKEVSKESKEKKSEVIVEYITDMIILVQKNFGIIKNKNKNKYNYSDSEIEELKIDFDIITNQYYKNIEKYHGDLNETTLKLKYFRYTLTLINLYLYDKIIYKL